MIYLHDPFSTTNVLQYSMKMFQCKQINGQNLFVRVIKFGDDKRALWYADGEENGASVSFSVLLGVCVFQPYEFCPHARVLVLVSDNEEEVTDLTLGLLDPVQSEQLVSYIKSMC